MIGNVLIPMMLFSLGARLSTSQISDAKVDFLMKRIHWLQQAGQLSGITFIFSRPDRSSRKIILHGEDVGRASAQRYGFKVLGADARFRVQRWRCRFTPAL
jgi:hypothetical protein